MRRIAPGWLTAPDTCAVLAALAPAAPHFVGGCVRDALMGRPTSDIDIAVATPPAETQRLAEAAGLKAIPTGADHGVVTVIADHHPFECATLRRDVATDGRRAVVAYAADIAEDAARRDFTLNALYADAGGRVLDPTGAGLADLDARRIRFIGDAETRIREDYLRILRFFRFHAQFSVTDFDPVGLAACHALSGGLARISRERIGAEMLKLLAAPDPEPALAAMGDILSRILPGARVAPGLTAAEAALGLAPSPLRRLGALGVDAEAAAGALRLSRADARALSAILAAGALSLPEAAYRHGAKAAESALALRSAPPPEDWRAQIAAGAAAQFPLKAEDLIACGHRPGPALGAALKALERAWIAAGFAATAKDLLASPAALRPTGHPALDPRRNGD